MVPIKKLWKLALSNQSSVVKLLGYYLDQIALEPDPPLVRLILSKRILRRTL